MKNNTILKAYRGEKTAYTPVWYMRQAGRSQAEYREIKKQHSLFEITHNPELCAYVTRLPVENYQNDAAILYKDIMSPLPGMGVDVEIKSGIGPVIDQPIRDLQAVKALKRFQAEKAVPYVLETIRLLTKEQLDVPLIGFSGAPFTLASYLIEGGPSKNHHLTKAFMHNDQTAWFLLMDKLGEMIIDYAKAQIKAGIEAFQLFDSWIGVLNEADYLKYVYPVMEKITNALAQEGVPLILFGLHTRHLLKTFNSLSVDVIGLDWRTSISEARSLGVDKVLQGNLDPSLLLCDWETIKIQTEKILDEGLNDGHHVFNLGHGVMPQANPATLKKLTSLIHTYSKNKTVEVV